MNFAESVHKCWIMRTGLKIGFSLFICFGWILNISAQAFIPKLFSEKDTIQLELSERYGLHYKHVVRAKQTLYSLSRVMGTSQEAIYELNPYLEEREIQPGEIIIIPVNNRVVITDKDSISDAQMVIPAYYKVRHKETLFMISKRYFEQSTLELMRRNNLRSFTLDVGTQLHVGWIPIGNNILTELKSDSILLAKKNWLQGNEPDLLGNIHNTRGIAVWDKTNQDKTNLFVLHPTARVNTILELTNPMLNRKVYAKVVAKLPERIYPKDVSIVISPGVAEALGAIDSRFLIEMRYFE